jgi:hypothetical protein
MHLYNLGDLQNNPVYLRIHEKYGPSGDSLRWALKPVFLNYLLNNLEDVVYIDCDVHFYANPAFLFDELKDHPLLLSPHWASTDPMLNEEKFMMNFQAGIFNAGFIGVSKKGQHAMAWWAEACAYAISREMAKGFFVDQRYLDIMPVLVEDAKILRHKGCNIGSWNIDSCKRSVVNGRVMINNEFPVVFIHFNQETVKHILNNNDSLLKPYLDEYTELLRQNGFDLLKNFDKIPVAKYENTFYTFKHQLRLRTRLKRFLYKLAEKL